jgi:hypothetical protein
MKDYLMFFKSNKGTGKEQSSKELPTCKLYVVSLNKPLIDLHAMTDPYTNDYFETTLPYRGSVYTRSMSASNSDDRIPVILSEDDEMMLFNEGFSENY